MFERWRECGRGSELEGEERYVFERMKSVFI